MTKEEAIEKYRPYIAAAGFGDCMIDFSDASEEVIRRIGEVCKEYCKENMRSFEVRLVVSYKEGGNEGALKGAIHGAINHGLLEPMDGGEVTGYSCTVKEIE